jgi:hypothetical protein
VHLGVIDDSNDDFHGVDGRARLAVRLWWAGCDCSVPQSGVRSKAGVRMSAGVVVAAFVALWLAQPATGFFVDHDGRWVEIGCQLVLPEGTPPSAGWHVVMLPGREMDAALGEPFVHRSFASCCTRPGAHALRRRSGFRRTSRCGRLARRP